MDALFGKAIIHDSEEILKTPHGLVRNIFQLYHKGIESEFGAKDNSYEDWIARIKATAWHALEGVRASGASRRAISLGSSAGDIDCRRASFRDREASEAGAAAGETCAIDDRAPPAG
ncbi:MAG TPA: hypothetical protein VH397_07090 [Xanthobacteraceae bacterium]